uniref:GCN5-like N-acetyltransferase n=1 Tax=Gracilariopsis heteroclada TaxID=172978 RepID=A0A344V6C4_9FLOR|nr:GCN5-like N-acetyltransferase [Gracilariopsis heteroclada]AXE43511.1 GCN5-like N-acetyltransferase [Gracilariopsis heteroclada]
MAFWKSFFKQTNIFATKKEVRRVNLIEEVLLVKHFKNKGEIINVYLSLNSHINLYDLEKLCDSVGWVRRPLKKVKIAIDNSFLTVSIFYEYKKEKYLIGFARATSDTSFNATIWDVVIHPDFQGKGLGKILIHQVIKYLRYSDISTITLFADPQVVSFYKQLGFITDPDGVKGMFWYPL